MSTNFGYGEQQRIAEEAIPEMRPNLQSNGWLRGPCPFCLLIDGKRDKKWSFGFNRFTRKYSCFRCGTFGFLQGEVDEFEEAPPPAPLDAIDPPEGFFPLWTDEAFDSPSLHAPLAYLASRGMTQDLIAWARIGACVKGRYKGRVVIPVFNETGLHWIGFVARAWFKGANRTYLNSDGAWGSATLYNGGALELETTEPAIIVEGVFDTFPYWPDGVAVFGKPGPAQVDMLVSTKRPFAMVLDGDAWREGWGIALKCRMLGANCGAVRLPPGKDPDQLCKDSVRQAARESLSCIEPVMP